MEKITSIIQARMNSTRFPNKVMKKIQKKHILHYVINQVKSSKKINDIIIATTESPEDDAIIDFCKKTGIKYFRGSKDDVLDRYYNCAKKFDCGIIVRITSDCPLIDPTVIDEIIETFQNNSFDYVSNNLEKKDGNWMNSTCNYPQGMTVEVASFHTLEKAWKEARKPSEREHVFPYVQFNPSIFKLKNIKYPKDLSYIRCTIDHPEDLIFLKELYKRLPKKQFISIKDIEEVIMLDPTLVNINNWFDFEEGYKKSLLKDF